MSKEQEQEQPKKKGRGGFRAGAGRPAGAKDKQVRQERSDKIGVKSIQLRISAELLQKLEKMAEERDSNNVNDVVREILEQA